MNHIIGAIWCFFLTIFNFVLAKMDFAIPGGLSKIIGCFCIFVGLFCLFGVFANIMAFVA